MSTSIDMPYLNVRAHIRPTDLSSMIAGLLANIPAELRALPVWCLYKDAPDETGFGVVRSCFHPLSVEPIDVNDISALIMFDQAVAALADDTEKRFDGIGLCLHRNFNPLVVLYVANRKPGPDGLPSDQVYADWVNSLGSYAEVNEDGRYIQVLMHGILPPPANEQVFDQETGEYVEQQADDHSSDIADMFAYTGPAPDQAFVIPITGRAVHGDRPIRSLKGMGELFIDACRRGTILDRPDLYALDWQANEMWAARQFITEFGDQVRYAAEEKQFYVWNGRQWVCDTKRSAMMDLYKDFVQRLADLAHRVPDLPMPTNANIDDLKAANAVARAAALHASIRQDANEQAPDENRLAEAGELLAGYQFPEQGTGKRRASTFRDGYKKFIAGLHFLRKRDAILTLVSQDKAVAVEVNTFDQHGDQLNTPGGVVDLTNGTLLRHDPNMLHAKITAAAYIPELIDTDCPVFIKALQMVCSTPDGKRRPDLERYVQVVLGYMATADIRAQCMFIAYGLGFNGKSALFSIIRKVLGDYAIKASKGLVTNNRRESRDPFGEIRLRGARFVLQSETEPDDALTTGDLKRLTDDVITTRPIYGAPVEFAITHKLMLDSNYEPKIRELDKGTWRRVKLIPCDFTIPEDQRDTGIDEKLWAERDAILAWVVRGAIMYYTNGLDFYEPSCVKAAVAAYKAESDILAEFVDEHVVAVDPTTYAAFKADAFTPNEDLRQAYLLWAEARGVPAVADKTLRDYLVKERKHKPGKNTTGNKRGWLWLLVKPVEVSNQRRVGFGPNTRTSHKLTAVQQQIIAHIDGKGEFPREMIKIGECGIHSMRIKP